MKLVNLHHQLILEGVQRIADGAGGFSETWVTLGTLWAEIHAGTGREKSGEFQTVSTVGYRITLRTAPPGASARPKPGQRFRYGARIFAIQAVGEHDVRGQYLTCFAREEVLT